MLQFLKDPKFDFMGIRRPVIAVGLVIVVLCIGIIAVKGLNLGVEFTGGSTLRLQFASAPDLPSIRSALNGAGLDSSGVTTIGDAGDNEVYIRLGTVEGDLEADEETTRKVVDALRPESTPAASDLNVIDSRDIQNLIGRGGVDPTAAGALAQAIVTQRTDKAIFTSYDELAGVEGMTPAILQQLRDGTSLGPIALREQSYIGPAIGKELTKQAGIAILGSLLGMLIYIWIRFQFQWGLAAVAALAHDTVVTLGLFSLFEKEMSLPVVAAFLTLVGYSVNDTVVVFDRIRENIRKKAGAPLVERINLSINQTLSRTIITSGLTFLVVLGLYVFGGAALQPFAFVLTVGVIVGTYSSIFVASPILLLAKQAADKRSAGRERAGASG